MGNNGLIEKSEKELEIEMTLYGRIVNVGLNLKEYNWVYKFIEKYHDYLPPVFKSEIYNLSKAKYFLAVKEYDMSLSHLHKLRFKDEQYYYLSKLILIKIYYELGDFESLRFIIINLNKFLRLKKSIYSRHLSEIKDFIKYVLELLKLHNSLTYEKKKNLILLKKELENINMMYYNTEWLLEKLKEI